MRRHDLHPEPLRQLERWFAEASAVVPVPEAAALATATADGAPSARMVLVKGFEERGLSFFSNYGSRKGGELEANPRAALLFHWSSLGRQVRVEGQVERLPAAESDAYFATRPRQAQLGAHASRQSSPLASREELERRLAELDAESPPEVPRPEWWGGYLLVPAAWEFWQHRDSRLHDRFRYEPTDAGWLIARLAP